MDRPKSSAEKTTRTVVDTISFTIEAAKRWLKPPFQRNIKINDRVKETAAVIKTDGGVLPGIITLGHVKGDPDTYIVDGQHRLEAFYLSECAEGFADVRNCFFDTLAEMGEEFVRLNSSLVRMTTDDILRGMENAIPALALISRKCPFVGYDQIRRYPASPMVSMSVCLRAWAISEKDTLSASTMAAAKVAQELGQDSANDLVAFLTLALNAWGKDAAYVRLYGTLNLTVCMWLYRRLVLSTFSVKTAKMSRENFSKCLMALSADPNYCDWLTGRKLSERDRAPAYARVKSIFQSRMKTETGQLYKLPAPPWTLGKVGR